MVATFSDANSKEYKQIDEEIQNQIFNNYATQMDVTQI